MKIILLYIFTVFLVSCSSSPKPKYRSDTLKERGLSIHGNFCGKNIPTIETKNIPERIRILNGIKAIDSIDLACKQHDICYAKKGYYNLECDKEVVQKVSKQINNISMRPSCRSLANFITNYFITVNPSNSKTLSKYIENSGQGLANTTSNALNSTSIKTASVFVIGAVAVADIITSPIDILSRKKPFQLLRNIPKASKAVLVDMDRYDVLPKRYTKCD